MIARSPSSRSMNDRASRGTRGLTEVRGSYYSVVGRRYLEDLLGSFGEYIDGLKYAGGSFALMSRRDVREVNDLAHEHGLYVSTGGWVERVLGFGREAVRRYIAECGELGFDVVELSSGFISLSEADLLALVREVKAAGLKPKPELGVQFGAGGATAAQELEAEGVRDVTWVIDRARRCLEAGAELVMIESEGITESVRAWRTDVVSAIVSVLGNRAGDVRGRRPAGVRVVREDLRAGREPLHRPQPDRAARMPAHRRVGHQEHLGPCGGLCTRGNSRPSRHMSANRLFSPRPSRRGSAHRGSCRWWAGVVSGSGGSRLRCCGPWCGGPRCPRLSLPPSAWRGGALGL